MAEVKDRSIYLTPWEALAQKMEASPETPFYNYAKVATLIVMNMRYEKVAFNKNLDAHPYDLTRDIVLDADKMYDQMTAIAFIESDQKDIDRKKSNALLEKHEELWQEIWSRHNDDEFKEFVDMKAMRLDINDLVPLVEGQDCVDFGCGNGSFSFAMLDRGANAVHGIDFGTKSVRYAQAVAEKWNIQDKATFEVDDVTGTKLESNRYGFAVSNGVFHHLEEEKIPAALKEVARVMKPGGWFWYYVDGKDAISMHLWDRCVKILKDVDVLFIEQVLTNMNVKRNKMVHMMDALSATYLHTTWEEVTSLLANCGFGNFRRITGGTATDFDHDVLESDPYGTEKFGSGDMRIICQRL